MSEIAIWAELKILPGKQAEAEEWFAFSRRALADEPGTTSFFAVRIDDTTYGVFDTFRDQAALDDHKAGPTGVAAVAEKVGTVFAGPPSILLSTLVERT